MAHYKILPMGLFFASLLNGALDPHRITNPHSDYEVCVGSALINFSNMTARKLLVYKDRFKATSVNSYLQPRPSQLTALLISK